MTVNRPGIHNFPLGFGLKPLRKIPSAKQIRIPP